MSELLLEEHKFNQITDDEIKDIIRKCKRKNIELEILEEVERLYKINKNDYYDFRDGNFCLESELLDFDTAKKLITWISGKKNHHVCWYKFELLFNMKHDGLKSETFHKNCDGKGPTIVIIKLFNNNLIGGYNPLDWECRNVFKKTKDSFLFQKYKCLNGYIHKKSNIIPGYENKAIACSPSNCSMFGITNLYIQSGSKHCNLISSNYESLNMSGDYLIKSYEVLRVIKQK
ncbi:30493_t:CDS:2 [Gigaspora margarita]|uniref:30493_t:CDS:1 n=1 Tax=Gigaspora margarita TaxID=4874 RepID=A0ABN7UKS3_GIGMA|nr:30493_t:CDS:2 [Gigaspora margarita]